MNSAKIAHISDLHFPPGKNLEQILQDFYLVQAIEHIKREEPDYIVVTGDFFQKGPCEFEVVTQFLIELVNITKSKDKHAIIICPGNHDFYLQSVLKDVDKEEKVEQLKKFLNELSDNYITPFGKSLENKRILNENNNILIYPINSCPLLSDLAMLKDIDWAKSDSEVAKHLLVITQLRKEVEQAVQTLPDITKVAAMHHNIHPYSQDEAIVWYSNRLAGILENELTRLEFHMLLHGHTHERTAIREASKIGDQNRLFLISAPSIMGADRQESAFNIITSFEEKRLFSRPEERLKFAEVVAAKTQENRNLWNSQLLPLSKSIPRTFSVPFVYMTVGGIGSVAKANSNRIKFRPGLLLLEKVAGGEAVKRYQELSRVEVLPLFSGAEAEDAVKRMIKELDIDLKTGNSLCITSCGTPDQYKTIGTIFWEALIGKLVDVKKDTVINDLFFIEESDLADEKFSIIERVYTGRERLIAGASMAKAQLDYQARYMVVPSLDVCFHNDTWVMDYAVAPKVGEPKNDKVVIFDHLAYKGNYDIQLFTGNAFAKVLQENVINAFGDKSKPFPNK